MTKIYSNDQQVSTESKVPAACKIQQAVMVDLSSCMLHRGRSMQT